MEETVLTEEIIRGLKAKLKYQGCDLTCSPITKCECEEVLREIDIADHWIESLPGDESSCDG